MFLVFLILIAILILIAFVQYTQTCPLCGGKLHYLGDDPIKGISIYECEKCKEWFV